MTSSTGDPEVPAQSYRDRIAAASGVPPELLGERVGPSRWTAGVPSPPDRARARVLYDELVRQDDELICSICSICSIRSGVYGDDGDYWPDAQVVTFRDDA